MTAVQAKFTTVGLGIAMIAIPGLFYLFGGGLNARTIVAFWLAGAAALLGSFFVMYCAFAIFGIVLGQKSDIRIRKAG